MDGSALFFEDWAGIGRAVAVGLCAYAALLGVLRVPGRRTLAKLAAFDLVVTVALGSTFASILRSGLPLAEGGCDGAGAAHPGAVFGGVPVGPLARFARAVRSEPLLLVRRGAFCRDAMHAARVTEDELHTVLHTVLRGAAHGAVSEVAAVLLESNGAFSVLPGGAAAPEVRTSGARARG